MGSDHFSEMNKKVGFRKKERIFEDFSEIEKDDLVGISWGKTQGVSTENILKYLVISNF